MIESTVWLVFVAKAVRTFCYGYLGILIPLHLAALGLGARGIGLAVTLTLGASALLTAPDPAPGRAPREPRRPRRARGASSLAAGVLLATARAPALVVLAAMLGNVAVSTGETGPFLSIEQVLVARAAAGRDLTLRMSLYNLVGYVAAGAGRPRGRGAPASGEARRTPGTAPLFWLFALSGGVQALLYARLPDVPVRRRRGRRATRFPRGASSTASRRSSRSTRSRAASSSRACSSTGSTPTSRSRRPPSAPCSPRPSCSRRARSCSRPGPRSGSGCEHDGVLPPRLERPPHRHGIRADGGARGGAPAPAGAPLADGRPTRQAFLMLVVRGRRARGDGDGDQRRPDRGAGGEPGA